MKQKRNLYKILALFSGISLFFALPGLPISTCLANTGTTEAASRSLDTRTVNLNIAQEDCSYTIAGISDPGQPANSQLEAKVSRTNNWGEEKDSDGNVVKHGSYVYYGCYQQSSNGNGGYHTEPLKWRVLDADTQDFNEGNEPPHTMFLMADKVLEQVKFNENKDDGGIYSTCNLRKWLNSETFQGPYPEGGFLNNAFSVPERTGIAVSSKRANDEIEIETLIKDNSGLSQNGLIDKIFVLSAEEANSNAFGFYYLKGYGSSNSRLFTATDYAKDKGICSTTSEQKDYWLRSRITDSNFSAAIADCTGWLWAANVDGIYSDGSSSLVGVAPSFNLDLSAVSFTSATGMGKSSFALTSASDSAEWNLTMAGGSGFTAARHSNESGPVNPGGEITVDITDIGTPNSGVSYSQISAILADENNIVLAYGKIAGLDKPQAAITIPAEIPAGNYTLKIFAEDVNSSSGQNLTDFASNMADIPIIIGNTSIVTITNPTGSHITYSSEEGNGTEKQGVLKDGGSYTPVTYIADNGYYFPENYSIPETNGIKVTRNSVHQITISGIPTKDASLTLAAATEKAGQPAPEGLGETEGKITGTDTAMEYRAKPTDGSAADTEWADCIKGSTTVAPGIWQIRYKETDTKKAGAVEEITVYARYTVLLTNPADSHILLSETSGSGTEQQKVAAGKAIMAIKYTAEEGFYFPDDYTTAGQNGITVTRDSENQLTVSGTPTGDVNITLSAAAQKPEPTPTPAPEPTPVPKPSPEPAPGQQQSSSPTPGQKPSLTPSSATQNPNGAIEEGYDIFAAPCGKKLNSRSLIMTGKKRSTFTTLVKRAAKKMTGRKNYKIKIKAYKLVNGRKVYLQSSPTYHVAGAKNKTYTNAKKISFSRKTIILKKGASHLIKAKIIKNSKKKKLLPKSHGPSLRYKSTDKKIAVVSSNGKIRAKKKGVCYVYITALNGVTAKIKVKVK